MLAKKPPMGFNTWNTFGPNISDAMIRETADAMAARGFLDAGYEYLVIDDCWSERDRDPVTGRLVPDHVKFPNGMKAVADYVHSKGLKFGMYSCAGVRTCGDYPSSFDHEYLDAETFAEWGVDFLKYDFCNVPPASDGPLLYRRMGMALRSSGREILFSACNWGSDDVWSWIRSAGAHMYRSTGDINDTPGSFINIYKSQLPKLGASAPYCWNDLDMLTVGMYGNGNVGHGDSCTIADYRAQFATWCMCASPLMLGCDVRNCTEEARELLCNRELIAINQDEEARPPFPIGGLKSYEAKEDSLAKFLSDGTYAILCINNDENPANRRFSTFDLGITTESGYALELTDVFTGKCEGTFKDYVRVPVPGRDCRLFRARLVK